MWKFEILGAITQLILLISIYDVYKENVFISDLNYQNEPIADRIVIFILSGLRPDMVYTTVNEMNHLPLWKEFSVHGILKSQAPTTSKNGFIAFTSGINEGLLTIVPINRTLDTIFDRVNGTLYFGPINNDKFYFKKNLWTEIKYDIDLNTNRYNVNDETLTKIQLSLNEIKNNKIILIHLKQIVDYSKTYDCLYKCIDIVINLFNQINNVFKFIENKLNNTSVYLLMADHGITSDGTYGGITNEETNTFFALWGKNIIIANNGDFILEQIQIANLITTVLGVEIPKNSLARTPVDLFMVSEVIKLQYKALNALHLASIALKSADQLQLFIKLLNYIHFEPYEGYKKIIEYEQLLKKQMKYDEINRTEFLSDQLINLSLYGIKHMKSTMNFMTIFLINTICIGWILLLSLTIINRYNRLRFKTSKEAVREEVHIKKRTVGFCVTLNSVFILIGVLAFIFVIVHSWPMQYFAYWLLPMIIWHRIICVTPKWKYFKSFVTKKTLPALCLNITLLISVCELLLWGIEHRILLFIAVFIITIYLTVRCFYINSAILLLSIVTSGSALALLIMIAHNLKHMNPLLLNISALIWITAGIIATYKMRYTFLDYFVTLLALVHYLCSMILMNIKFIKPDAKEFNIVWIQLATALFIPLLGSTLNTNRLKQIAISLSSIFLLFSESHESLALFILFVMLICWYYIEDEHEKKPPKTSIDLPIIFITLVLSCSHLMINTDDLNFINAKFANRFIEENHPLFEYILVLIKYCIVQYLIQTMFSVILRRRGEDASLFLVTILLLNCIGYRYLLQCIFWPDQNVISKQLTRHCIVQITAAFLLATFSLAKIVTSISIWTKCERLKDQVIKYFKEKPSE